MAPLEQTGGLREDQVGGIGLQVRAQQPFALLTGEFTRVVGFTPSHREAAPEATRATPRFPQVGAQQQLPFMGIGQSLIHRGV